VRGSLVAVASLWPVSSTPAPAPRGRHAPPLEVRQDRQRRRLFDAAAKVFTRSGYADATAEAIAREAGMSKATFYEHFDNKEDCIVALFDSANDLLVAALQEGRKASEGRGYRERVNAAVRAYLHVLRTWPDHSRTLLVEIVGAGPRAQERRDRMLTAIADYFADVNAAEAAAGHARRFASRYDAYAIVGAAAELSSRALRSGEPELAELEPVLERLVYGLIEQGVDGAQK
jgi:AcrR family transcriptional regulator